MQTHHYVAAGGIVLRGRGAEVLLLHKHQQDEYVLPKGHVEAGENLEQTAVRETREETRYAHLRVLTNLGTLQSQYAYRGRWMVRDETYFVMQLEDEVRDDSRSHADALHDQQTFHRLWLPLAAAAARLTYEPAKTFASRAAAWVEANPLPAAT
jgi:8-oxo-dGTP pyrophosphatase MutT (NUDIX family)